MSANRASESYQLLRTTQPHAKKVESVAVSSHGKFLVSIPSDNKAKLWNIDSNKEVRVWENTFCAAFSIKDKFLILGQDDGTHVYETQNWKKITTLHSSSLKIRFTSNQKYLLGNGRNFTALWNVSNWKKLGEYKSHVVFSESGEFSAELVKQSIHITNTTDSTKVVWKPKITIPFGSYSIKGKVCFSQDDKRISFCDNNKVEIFNIKDKRSSLIENIRFDEQCFFLENDKHILITGSNGACDVLDIQNRKQIFTLKYSKTRMLTPKYFFYCLNRNRNKIIIRSTKTWEIVKTLKLTFKVIHLSKNKNWVVFQQKNGKVNLLNTDNLDNRKSFKHMGGALAIAFSKKANLFASGGFDQTLHVSTLDEGKHVNSLNINTQVIYGTNRVSTIAFSHDGKFLAAATIFGTVKIWNTYDWREVTHSIAMDKIVSLSFSNDGRYFAIGGADDQYAGPAPRIMIYDTNWNQIAFLVIDFGTYEQIQFSPNSMYLGSYSRDKVGVWPLESLISAPLKSIFLEKTIKGYGFCFSDDSSHLIIAQKETTYWQIDKKRYKKSYDMDSVILCSNKNEVIRGAYNTIYIKRSKGKDEVLAHSNVIDIKADGEYLISTSQDSVKFWKNNKN